MVYAVIDTNVFVSALLTKTNDAATVQVFNAIADGRITPLYHRDILKEYQEVLSRPKFKFRSSVVKALLDSIVECGLEVFPKPTGEILVDVDDLVFYEVVMEKRDDNSYLVTGNKKHYPVRDFIVTPAEMMNILRDNWNYTEAKVDAIVIIAGLVHIENSDLKAAFMRMHSVLNENGRIFMSVRDGVGKIPERSLTTIDGEEYDRNLIAHTLDGLNDLIPLDYAQTEWLPGYPERCRIQPILEENTILRSKETDE